MNNPLSIEPDYKVIYKGYIIRPENGYNYKYDFVHNSYDGAIDAKDNRCGWGNSIQECKNQIDEIEYERHEKECLKLLRKSYPDHKLNDDYDFSSHVFSANDMIDFAINFLNKHL